MPHLDEYCHGSYKWPLNAVHVPELHKKLSLQMMVS